MQYLSKNSRYNGIFTFNNSFSCKTTINSNIGNTVSFLFFGRFLGLFFLVNSSKFILNADVLFIKTVFLKVKIVKYLWSQGYWYSKINMLLKWLRNKFVYWLLNSIFFLISVKNNPYQIITGYWYSKHLSSY